MPFGVMKVEVRQKSFLQGEEGSVLGIAYHGLGGLQLVAITKARSMATEFFKHLLFFVVSNSS